MIDKKNSCQLLLALVISSLLVLSLATSVKNTNARTSSCYSEVITPVLPSHALPVILIHGYKEDSTVWSEWEGLLYSEKVPYCSVTFHADDECGRASDHANELNQIIKMVKDLTHQNKVNIIGHSKGGLDARVYLSQTPTRDVANLIMIGTPNAGSRLADRTVYYNLFNPFLYNSNSFCTPALYDLQTRANDTEVSENPHTKYYTIYGDWNPSFPCRNLGRENVWYPILYNLGEIPNDGIVSKKSVESLTNFTKLGHSFHCHTDLLSGQEYQLARNLLISGR